MHHSLLLVQKCNNVTDLYELPDFCPLNSPDLNTFIPKYGAASLPEKAQDVDDLRVHLFDTRVGVEQSVIDDGIDLWSAFKPQDDILNILVIYISQNITNCNKLS